MSTTTTLGIGLDRIKGDLTLDVKRLGVVVTSLPADLRTFWEQKLRQRSTRWLSDDDIENSLKHIVVSSFMKSSTSVKGIQAGSMLSLSLPATNQHQQDLIWRGIVAWISTTVTF